MEAKEINIAEILKGKSLINTKLWSPIFGVCKLERLHEHTKLENNYIEVSAFNTTYYFSKHGIFAPKGELMLFPSKSMRDWSKFAWRKGDILISKDTDSLCVFDSFEDDTYSTFNAKYYHNPLDFSINCGVISRATEPFTKVDDDEAKNFIRKIEEHYGGKLNLSTLEIEHPKPEFKDGDIVFVTDNHCYNAICIYKEISGNMLFYHAKIDADTLFLKPQNDSLTIEDRAVRIATEEEKQQLFSALEKEGKRWNAETKTLEDLPKKCEFKPKDWCLMRQYLCVWHLCQYAFKNDRYSSPYFAVGGNSYNECIPYNDQTAHLLGTTDDWKGGEE